jgi:hypothetical protein
MVAPPERRRPSRDRGAAPRFGAGARFVLSAASRTVPFEQIGQSAVNRLCLQKSELISRD